MPAEEIERKKIVQMFTIYAWHVTHSEDYTAKIAWNETGLITFASCLQNIHMQTL